MVRQIPRGQNCRPPECEVCATRYVPRQREHLAGPQSGNRNESLAGAFTTEFEVIGGRRRDSRDCPRFCHFSPKAASRAMFATRKWPQTLRSPGQSNVKPQLVRLVISNPDARALGVVAATINAIPHPTERYTHRFRLRKSVIDITLGWVRPGLGRTDGPQLGSGFTPRRRSSWPRHDPPTNVKNAKTLGRDATWKRVNIFASCPSVQPDRARCDHGKRVSKGSDSCSILTEKATEGTRTPT